MHSSVREGGARLGATLVLSGTGQPFPLPSGLHTNTRPERGEETGTAVFPDLGMQAY